MENVIRIDENTYSFEDGFVRFFLLIGKETAAMIDSGVNTPHARQIAEDITDLPIILINTHGDGDHTSGTGAFGVIRIAKEDYENCGMKEKYPNTALWDIEDGEEISLGERTLKMIRIPGHTEGSVAILDVEKRRLFAGDSVQDGIIYMFGGHRSPDRYEAALHKLIGMKGDYDQIVASHGTMLLDGDYTEKVLAGWQAIQAGEAAHHEVELFGQTVMQYDTKACGFYCEKA